VYGGFANGGAMPQIAFTFFGVRAAEPDSPLSGPALGLPEG
jgi:hypothetical protein